MYTIAYIDYSNIKKKQDMINKKELKEKSWEIAKKCKIIIKELEGFGRY